MTERSRGERQETLFPNDDAPTTGSLDDLPLRTGETSDEAASDDVAPTRRPSGTALATDDELAPPRRRNTSQQIPLRAAMPIGDEPPAEQAAPVGGRILAGLLDLGVHLGVVSLATIAVILLDVPLTLDGWPPMAAFTLIFSFLYWTVPLAFWGQTPGMALLAHQARNHDDEPLTFEQTVLRWFGSLLTLLLVGLPILIAVTGRSLSDRLSESKTVSQVSRTS